MAASCDAKGGGRWCVLFRVGVCGVNSHPAWWFESEGGATITTTLQRGCDVPGQTPGARCWAEGLLGAHDRAPPLL
jgi:hypothetical protein